MTDFSRLISNGKKNCTFFNLASQLITSNLFHFKNIFNYFYKKKFANAYIMQMGQIWIIDFSTSNHITW